MGLKVRMISLTPEEAQVAEHIRQLNHTHTSLERKIEELHEILLASQLMIKLTSRHLKDKIEARDKTIFEGISAQYALELPESGNEAGLIHGSEGERFDPDEFQKFIQQWAEFKRQKTPQDSGEISGLNKVH